MLNESARRNVRGGLFAPLTMCFLFGAAGTAAARTGMPEVTHESVSKVTQTGATVKGKVDPDGLDTSWEAWLEYAVCQNAPPGEEECDEIAIEPIGSGTLAPGEAPATVRLRLNGRLSAGYTYTYWIVASNSDGESKGAHRQFTTQSAGAPVIESESITHEGAGEGATLKAIINPEGLPTTYKLWAEYQPCLHLECELLLEGGEPVGGGEIPGGGVVNVSLPHSGLTGDSYVYWAQASNADGGVEGPHQEFPAL